MPKITSIRSKRLKKSLSDFKSSSSRGLKTSSKKASKVLRRLSRNPLGSGVLAGLGFVAGANLYSYTKKKIRKK